MKKKDLDKKIKEKCRELDLIELEKKKKRIKDIKWIIASVLLVVLILISVNNSDPSKERVDKVKEQKIVDGQIENYQVENMSSLKGLVTDNFGSNLLLMLSIVTFIWSSYYFLIKPFWSYKDY